MITPEMARLIRQNTLALVAAVTPEGRPAVSPKATVAVVDERRLAFSDLRSPGTLRNIRANPAVELNFIDVFRRRAVRIAGEASYAPRGAPRFDELLASLGEWRDYESRMRGIFEVRVEAAATILSPAYDHGANERDLAAQWLAFYGELVEGGRLFGDAPEW